MTSSQDESLGGDDEVNGDGSPLQNISEDGDIPTSRFRDAQSANDWFGDKLTSDYWAALDRTLIDSVTDGAAPMSQSDLIANGMGNNFNINFGRAFAKEEQSLSAFNELGDSEEQLIRCEIDWSGGTPAQRDEWARIYSDGYTRLMRFHWPDYQPNMLMLAKGFIRHGVSLGFRQSEYDWRWAVSRLGDMQVSRRQGCSVDDFQCVGQRSFEYPTDVYAMIQDHEAAKKVGWDIEAVKKAIHGASIDIVQGTDSWNWDQLSRDAKDNGLYMTKGKDPQVEMRHFWVKEFSGKVSHLIASPTNNEKFLYKKADRWDSTADCMTLFTYGIGNGDLYSIRGLGYKIFALEQMFNIIMSRMGDRTLRDLSYLWQPSSADGLMDAQQIVWGGDTLVPQGMSPVEVKNTSNLSTALQMLNMLSNIESINTGTYTASQQLLPGGRPDRKSATEAQIEATQEAVLTTSAKVLFFQSLDRLDQMTVRALNKRDYPRNMPGGELRWKLFRYCLDRGMPEKAFYNVTCVRHTRPIGMGSPAEQQAKLNAIMQIFPLLDPIAQKAILRKQMVTNLGPDYANLVPEAPRAPHDKKDAELEASLFVDGIQPEIMPDEDAAVHLSEHIPFAANTLAALEQQEIDPKEAIKRLTTAIPHIQQTFQLLQQNPTKKKEIQQFQQAIAQISAQTEKILQNYNAQQQAEQEALQKEQQAMSAEQIKQQRENLAFENEQRRLDERTASDIERSQWETESKVRHSAAKTEAGIAHKDALTSQEVSDKDRLTTQKLAVTDLETAQDIRNAEKAPAEATS